MRARGGSKSRARRNRGVPAAGDGSVGPRLVGGLITRRLLFGADERWGVRLSPDGEHLAFIAVAYGTSNVWVAPREDLGLARPVTPFRKGTIDGYCWAYTNRHIVVVRDVTGEENTRVHSVDIATRKVVDLMAVPRACAHLEHASSNQPKHVLIGVNDRDPDWHDLWRVDVRTGARRLVAENPGWCREYVTDQDFRVQLMETASGQYLRPPGRFGNDPSWLVEGLERGDAVLGFDARARTLVALSRKGRDTFALVAIDLRWGSRVVLASNPLCDIDNVLVHPRTCVVEGAAWTHARPGWELFVPELEIDFERLGEAEGGEINVTSRSLDDRHWTVAFERDDAPRRYYLYDRRAKRATRLFATNTELEGVPLASMRTVQLRASNQWSPSLVSYLTLPRRFTDRGATHPLPMVLVVHGGPHARDHWGFNPEHQWLASRGYAVLSVNFRGSTGFGRAFVEAGRREWGGKMQEDLNTAVEWAIREGIAIADKVAIMGGSYGGYAALAGLAFSPERFACGVAFAGPSNLVTMVARSPRYRVRRADRYWIGDPWTVEGMSEMLGRSPTEYVEAIQRPLLIAHGANDRRVPRQESDQMVDALRRHKKQVTYLVFFDEGHGLARAGNAMAYHAAVEAFLGKHLGGRVEPVAKDLAGGDYLVAAGAEHVPGLGTAHAGRSARARRKRAGT